MQVMETDSYTRLSFSMNSPLKDLEVQDRFGHPMTVSFSGAMNGAFKPVNRNFQWPNLKGIFVDSRNGRVQVFIKRGFVGSVAVDQGANQLVLRIPHTFIRPSTAADEVSPGIRHIHMVRNQGAGPVRINVLEIDPKNPAVEITPALASNRMGGKANVAAMVDGNQAVAGINGSFFKPDVGTPLGILIINQELIAGPIYDRVALGVTDKNNLVMDRLRLGGEVVLPGNRTVRLDTINQPRVKASHTVVYTSRWGKTAPKVPANGLQVLIRNEQVVAVSRTSPLPIPRDGVVISGPATPDMQALASLNVGQPVKVNVYTLPDWSGMKHAIGGGPWLVRNGRPYIDLQSQHFSSRSLGFREPRSAVGITADGKMLLVAVDGRRKGVSIGMTLSEMSRLMISLGAVQAMNLDGGSSTQMAVQGKMVNRPSSGMVGVSNSLLIKRSFADTVASKNVLPYSR